MGLEHYVEESNANLDKNEQEKICLAKYTTQALDTRLEVKELFSLLENPSLSLKINQITSVSLTNCDIIELPLIFKILTVTHLDLSQNKLKEVPRCFYLGLEYVQELNLSNNAIELFDFEPFCSRELKTLNIRNNKFKDIPGWILNLKATVLESLDYSFNSIRQLGVKNLVTNNLPFRNLTLNNSMLRDQDLNFLKSLTNLDYLDLSNTRHNTCNILNDIDNLFIKPNWNSISVLKLNDLGIAVFPEGLIWLETLRELHLEHNCLHWLPTDGLEFLVNLEVLNISQNSISIIPEKLLWLEGLREIWGAQNQIEIIPDPNKCLSLEVLDLFNNQLSQNDVIDKISLDKFTKIDLEQNIFDTVFLGPEYLSKKLALRQTVPDTTRYDGPGIKIDEYQPDSRSFSSESDLDSISLRSDLSYYSNNENWDEPNLSIGSKKVVRNDEVTPSDDEWCPEPQIEFFVGQNLRAPRKKVYSSDWMFCDAVEF